jgi:hypothetical protein
MKNGIGLTQTFEMMQIHCKQKPMHRLGFYLNKIFQQASILVFTVAKSLS